jgi:hypothetical protein
MTTLDPTAADIWFSATEARYVQLHFAYRATA